MPFTHVSFCNKMPTRVSGMSLGESVTVCFGIPVPRLTFTHSALVTRSGQTWQPFPTPLRIRGLRARSSQHQIEASKRRCRHRDIKRVIASCDTDVMIPYKKALPGLECCSLATDRQLNRQPSLSNRVLSRNHSGGSHCYLVNKAALLVILK